MINEKIISENEPKINLLQAAINLSATLIASSLNRELRRRDRSRLGKRFNIDNNLLTHLARKVTEIVGEETLKEILTALGERIEQRIPSEVELSEGMIAAPGLPIPGVTIEDELVATCYGYELAGKIWRRLQPEKLETKVLLDLISEEPEPPLAPPLFLQGFYEYTPAVSAVADAVFDSMILKPWKLEGSNLVASKTFKPGKVELIIQKAAEEIIKDYGLDTLDVFHLLAIYAFQQPSSWLHPITVSGYDLLKVLNRLGAKNADRKTRKTKAKTLDELAHHIHLLKQIEVSVSQWEEGCGKKSKTFAVSISNLFDIEEIKPKYQLNIDGTPDESKMIDLHIQFKGGQWMKYFAANDTSQYLRQFGHIIKEVLALSNTQKSLAKRIGYWLVHKLEQHKSGKFQIHTVLAGVGEDSNIAEAKSPGSAANNLKRAWDRAYAELTSLENPYCIDYPDDCPSWALPSGKGRKPKGWVNRWLKLTLTFRKPAGIPSKKAQARTTPAKTNRPLKGTDLQKARLEAGVSLRKLAQWYGKTPAWLSKVENEKPDVKLTQAIAENLLKGIQHLAPKP